MGGTEGFFARKAGDSGVGIVCVCVCGFFSEGSTSSRSIMRMLAQWCHVRVR